MVLKIYLLKKEIEVNFVQGKDKNMNIINVDIAPEGTLEIQHLMLLLLD